MYDFTVLMGGIVFSVSSIYPAVRDMCKDYMTDGEPAFSIVTTRADIDFEREKSAKEDLLEGREVVRYKNSYLETLAVYRKIAENMLRYDTLLFHGSTIAVDGQGYIFTAQSGTGKSTHTGFWRQTFGERMVMVNDDKPLLRVTEDGVIAYGTPWDGKHHLSTNTSVPLRAICILTRAQTNSIVPVTPAEAMPLLFQQTYRPRDPIGAAKMLVLLDKLMQNTGLYRLGCNMDPEAAVVAYEGMNRKD